MQVSRSLVQILPWFVIWVEGRQIFVHPIEVNMHKSCLLMHVGAPIGKGIPLTGKMLPPIMVKGLLHERCPGISPSNSEIQCTILYGLYSEVELD